MAFLSNIGIDDQQIESQNFYGLASTPWLWGMPYLRDVHNLNRSFAADHMTIQLLSFALGALFWGWISDKIGRRKPFLISAAAAYVLSWIILIYLPWAPGKTGFAIFAFMGFSASGFVITFAAAKEIVHPQLSGMGVSVVNTGCFIGTALAAPIRIYCGFDLGWYHSKRRPDIQSRRLPERVHRYDPFIDSGLGSSFQG